MIIFENSILKTLRRLELRGSSGVQQLVGRNEKVFVCFYDGKVEAINSDREQDKLGRYLLRAELVSEEELERVKRKAEKAKKRLGETLVEESLLDSASLCELLMQQASDVFSRAVEESYEPGSFTPSPDWRMTYRLALGHQALGLELVRRRPVELQLALGQTIHLAPQDELLSLPWEPEEVSALSHLQSPCTLTALEERTGLGKNKLLAIVQVLLDLGLVHIVEPTFSSETALAKRERLPLEILIPEIRNPRLEEKIASVVADHSPINEQFRALKVRLVNQVNPPVRVMSLTSPRPKDGKSLVSTNLAMNFAREPGRRVLLIDGDLRGASVHEKLGITLGPGLYQYLLEGLDAQCYIRRVGPLFVMTAGGLAENAVELLSLKRMRELLRFAREEFDTVIVDAPPLLPIADARVIMDMTEATLLVVYQGQTPFRMVQRALEIVDKEKLLGVVLNGVKTTGLDGYQSYGYYFAYPYGSDKGKDGVIELKTRPRYTRRSRPSTGNILFK